MTDRSLPADATSARTPNPAQTPGFLGFSETRIAFLLLLTTPAMFGTNMLVARWMADTAPPVALAFWRWVGVLLLMLLLRGPQLWAHRKDVIAEWKDLAVLGALGMGVCGAFVYIGAETTTATNIGMLYASSPVLIAVLAWRFYGERFSTLQGVGGLLCLIGVLWIVFRGELEALRALRFAVGDVWVLAAVIGWAVYAIMVKYRPSGMGMMTRFTAICLFGVLILAPFTLWETMTVGAMPVQWDVAIAIGALVLIAGFGAFLAYAKVQSVLGAARGSLILYLNPIYVAVMAWALLSESLALYHLIGAALVLPGVYLANRQPRQADTNGAGTRTP